MKFNVVCEVSKLHWAHRNYGPGPLILSRCLCPTVEHVGWDSSDNDDEYSSRI